MNDIENDIYGIVSKAAKAEFPGLFTSGEYVDSPARFPALIFFQADSSVYERMRTSNIDNADRLMFAAYVYSNKVGYKKQEAKEIMDVVDREMAKLNFTRTTCAPAANVADATIFQLVARYEGVVDSELILYQS